MVIPIGSVVYYVDYEAPQTLQEAWYPCNGTGVDGKGAGVDSGSALGQIIGSRFGENAASQYLLPDLRGYFIRARDTTGSVDVDRSARIPTNPQAWSATDVGSVQLPAVAAHTHNVFNTYGTQEGEGDNALPVPIGSAQTDTTSQTCGATDSATPDIAAIETRPINVALTCSILAAQPTQRMPIGTILPFAGQDTIPTSSDGDIWVYCHGQPVPNCSPDYADLYQQWFPSGSTPPPPTAPDLQGLFIRGLDPTGTIDKDVGQRTGMFAGSLGGPNPTAYQADGFGPHTHALNSAHHCDHEGGVDLQCVSGDADGGDPAGNTSSTDGLTPSAFASDNRPLNIYLEYIIRIA
jgi:microcystin-dependent protein